MTLDSKKENKTIFVKEFFILHCMIPNDITGAGS